MSESPKTLNEKLAKYQNDSFDIWLQKTNIVAREQGDLNELSSYFLDNIPTELAGVASVFTSILTGKVSAAGASVSGTGTNFTNELRVGHKIRHPVTGEEREVTSIQSSTSLTIAQAFSENFTSRTIHTTNNPNKIIGTNTNFLTQVSIGSTLKFENSTIERLVVQIVSDTEILVNTPFPSTVSDSIIHNVSAINLVNAINLMYGRGLRGILIKAIAMS